MSPSPVPLLLVADPARSNRPHRRIAELEQEVATLRKRLASLKGGDLSSEPVAGPSTREEVRNEEDLASSTFPAYNVVDSLHVDVGTGEVSFMGPTSIPPMTGQSAGKSDSESTRWRSFCWKPRMTANRFQLAVLRLLWNPISHHVQHQPRRPR